MLKNLLIFSNFSKAFSNNLLLDLVFLLRSEFILSLSIPDPESTLICLLQCTLIEVKSGDCGNCILYELKNKELV